MRNLPNIYCSYSPGMPIINGTPGSLVDTMKKVLTNGTDPVSISSIVVENGIATITSNTDDLIFYNGSTILIDGCDEPLLNTTHYIVENNRTQYKFETTAADGEYSGSNMKVNQPGAGWQILYTGTNEAVFVSGNLDAFGACVRIIDTNARYADVELYETMSSLTTGVNKFNPATAAANRVLRIFKAVNATATAMNYWFAADNTTVHFSIERTVETTFTRNPITGFKGGCTHHFGELDTFAQNDKKHFYYIQSYRSFQNDVNQPASTSDVVYCPCYVNQSSDFTYDGAMWPGCVLTENNEIGNYWSIFSSQPVQIPIAAFKRNSGGLSRITDNYYTDPLFLVTDNIAYATGSNGNYGFRAFGKFRELLHANELLIGKVSPMKQFSVNGKKYILLPKCQIQQSSNTLFTLQDVGLIPVLIGEKWGD